jgi:hypothetical protein
VLEVASRGISAAVAERCARARFRSRREV